MFSSQNSETKTWATGDNLLHLILIGINPKIHVQQQGKLETVQRNQCDFHGEHWRLEQDIFHVLVHSPPTPSQHLHTIPRVVKIFQYPVNYSQIYIYPIKLIHTNHCPPLPLMRQKRVWESLLCVEEEEEDESGLPSTALVFCVERLLTNSNTITT